MVPIDYQKQLLVAVVAGVVSALIVDYVKGKFNEK